MSGPVADSVYHIAVEFGQYRNQYTQFGNYVIDCAAASVANGATVMLWIPNPAYDNQKIRVISCEDGYYELEFVHSGKLIDVAGRSMDSGAKVFQWERNGHDNQRWKIIPSETQDFFYIVARHSGKYLSSQYQNSVLLAETDDPKHFGAELTVYSNHHGSNQKWKFRKI